MSFFSVSLLNPFLLNFITIINNPLRSIAALQHSSEDVRKCLLTKDREMIMGQSTNTINVYPGELVSFTWVILGVLVRDYM